MSKDAPEDEPRQLTMHFIKSAQFRVIHCDGAVGGPSPDGDYIHMSLFSERNPIPLQIVYELEPPGRPRGEVSRVSREGLVREVEVDAVMDIATATTLIAWLTNQIKTLQDVHETRSKSLEGDD